MNRRQRGSALTERMTRRWQAADDSARLLAEVPDLTSLRLEVVEQTDASGMVGATKHTRVFVLASSPAYFFVPCGDARCEEGGHDITHEIMMQLRGGQERFAGDHACSGSVGTYPCTRTIRYSASATFRKPEP